MIEGRIPVEKRQQIANYCRRSFLEFNLYLFFEIRKYLLEKMVAGGGEDCGITRHRNVLFSESLKGRRRMAQHVSWEAAG